MMTQPIKERACKTRNWPIMKINVAVIIKQNRLGLMGRSTLDKTPIEFYEVTTMLYNSNDSFIFDI